MGIGGWPRRNACRPQAEGTASDFRLQLERWEQRYAGRPQDELLQIALLSLEREQLVSVTYHDDLLS